MLAKALLFAELAHKGQFRKYPVPVQFVGPDGKTDWRAEKPAYIEHCIEVQMLVRAVGGDEAQQCAALLHDTLEDTEATEGQLRAEFGDDVTEMVLALTDVSTAADGNRKARKAKDLAHLAVASGRAHTIKLADVVSNTRSIIDADKAFSKAYLPEMREMLRVLVTGDERLYQLAHEFLENAERRLALEGSMKELLKKSK